MTTHPELAGQPLLLPGELRPGHHSAAVDRPSAVRSATRRSGDPPFRRW
jgi:hypothetical protein